MEKSLWQNPWIRTVTTLLTVMVMAMIYLFSMEDAERSDRRSGAFADHVVKVVRPDYDDLDQKAQKEIYDQVQHVVRKCAHFTEYMMLGFMMRLCLESWFGHRMRKYRFLALIGLCAGAGYACTDEYHQLAIDGRSGQWTDVLVDTSGVLIGVTLGTMLIRVLDRKKVIG